MTFGRALSVANIIILILFSAKRYNITAQKEVILSAGATNSPQLLLLSGLGPAAQLKSLGIRPALDLPAVGANLIDHAIVCPPFRVNNDNTFDELQRNATLAAAAFQQWTTNATGRLSAGFTNNIGWLRIPKNESVWQEVQSDPSSGKTAGHYELLPVVSSTTTRVTTAVIS